MNIGSRVFLDTDVLVYVYDVRDLAKQKTAVELVESILSSGEGVISLQVVQEFCNVIIRKIPAVDRKGLLVTLDTVLAPMVVQTPDLAFYRRAISLQAANSLSFYDALIIQAAIDLGCETLYSEDLQAGQKFGGLTVVNPFV